jgi:hypothetical protein
MPPIIISQVGICVFISVQFYKLCISKKKSRQRVTRIHSDIISKPASWLWAISLNNITMAMVKIT